jgi:protoheme IX farnesyltransferase
MGVHGGISHILLTHTLLGTALVASGASAINMYLERNLDALMRRTLHRPLPAGRIQPNAALAFALMISGVGLTYLLVFVNALTSFISAVTLLSYALLYTPLKTKTRLCTLIGAVPGALPVAIGWAAAQGHLPLGAWILFSIIFFWQIPHFYAIGWMYREDYARAGFPMLPVLDVSGIRTSRQSSVHILLLMLATLGPFLTGTAGWVYLAGTLLSGMAFLSFGIRFARQRNRALAQKLFLASIIYLPVILALLMANKIKP